MNLYLGLADDELKGEYDEPTIGLILCKIKNKIVAEYALRDTNKPIGITEYRIAEMLPENIKGELPSIQEIEKKLDEELKEAQRPVDARLKTVKDKIKKLGVEELQTPATYEILQSLFTTGLAPLYEQIIQKISEEFNGEFLSHSFNWICGRKEVKSIEEVQAFWDKEENLKKNQKIDFGYTLFGFKKAGIEESNVSLGLAFEMSTYWYGFTCINYNKQRPFLKKMYHQSLTKEDIQVVEDVLVSQLLDRMDVIIKNIENKNN